MKRIMMVYDQIQAGAGTKDDKMVPLKATKEVVGPAVMMDRFLKKNDEKVIACVYCGNGTYNENPDEIIRKITALAAKLKADAVICGPCFNYADYAAMAAATADSITKHGIPAVACMSKENADTISAWKDKVAIVKGPKKGETGLNEALENLCVLTSQMADGKGTKELEARICY